MAFNSFEFLLFFLFFYFLFWQVLGKNLKIQNLLLLSGSYFFYAWLNWKFLLLLIVSTSVCYAFGILIHKTPNEKKKTILVYVSIIQVLLVLFFFKYYNFFITSVHDFLSLFNINANIQTLTIIMPLGISFYSFRLISYMLDINNEKYEPTNDWVVFFNYASFFPCLIAGPIDRANNLIPQLENKRVFNYSQTVDGLRQIVWGMFKKIVIADSCSTITSQIFDNYQTYPGSSLLLAAFLYIIQIYADFSGYSDIAIGVSRLLGFSIPKNFNFPFFAQNIAEFWQRWHISLTSWMTEYIYTPLSFIFRRYKKQGILLSILINFILVGLWHGSKWTFIVFGLLHGLYFIPLILSGTLNKKNKHEMGLKMLFGILKTFTIVMLTAIIFKCETIAMAFQYYKILFSKSLLSFPLINSGYINLFIILVYILLMLLIEWFGREEQHGIANTFTKKTRLLRWSFYIFLLLSIYYFSFVDKTQQFIYLQF